MFCSVFEQPEQVKCSGCQTRPIALAKGPLCVWGYVIKGLFSDMLSPDWLVAARTHSLTLDHLTRGCTEVRGQYTSTQIRGQYTCTEVRSQYTVAYQTVSKFYYQRRVGGHGYSSLSVCLSVILSQLTWLPQHCVHDMDSFPHNSFKSGRF